MVLHLFLYTEVTSRDLGEEFNMFKWLTDMFKDDRCKCRGCEVTRYGWGYAPCANMKVTDFTPPPPRSTKQPPRKI